MRCPRCQTENPSQARFCIKCGARALLACRACGTELPADAAFCFSALTRAARVAHPDSYTPKHLAERILTSRAGMEGRIVPLR